jgi:hypothetical protein
MPCRSVFQRHTRHVVSSAIPVLGSWVQIPLQGWIYAQVFILCLCRFVSAESSWRMIARRRRSTKCPKDSCFQNSIVSWNTPNRKVEGEEKISSPYTFQGTFATLSYVILVLLETWGSSMPRCLTDYGVMIFKRGLNESHPVLICFRYKYSGSSVWLERRPENASITCAPRSTLHFNGPCDFEWKIYFYFMKLISAYE